MFAARTLFPVCAAFIVYVTTIPWDFRAPSLDRVAWLPLWDFGRGRLKSLPDLAQNVALFVPFGLLGWFAGRGRPGGAWARVARVGALGLLLSLLVESLQTMSRSRTPSTTDVAANFAGALLGAACALAYTRRLAPRVEPTIARTLRERPGLLVCGAFLLAITLGSLYPFVPTLDVGLVRRGVRRFLDAPWGVRPWQALLPDALLYGALGLLFATEIPAALARGRRLTPLPFTAASLALLAAGLEALQFLLPAHGPSLADGAAAVAGGTTGAALAVAMRTRPARALGDLSRSAPRLVVAFAVALPTLRALEPFRFVGWNEGAARIDAWSFVPLARFFQNVDLTTIANTVHVAGFFLPLGYTLAARGRPARLAAAACLALALALEVAQIAVAGRTFDVTEGLFAAAAGLLGAHLAAPAPPGASPVRG